MLFIPRPMRLITVVTKALPIKNILILSETSSTLPSTNLYLVLLTVSDYCKQSGVFSYIIRKNSNARSVCKVSKIQPQPSGNNQITLLIPFYVQMIISTLYIISYKLF